MNMAVLTAQNVVYTYRNRYQTVRAVDEVSAEFEAGTFYAIVGASGSGKTTFLSLLAGLDVPTEGAILWDGKETAALDRDRYRFDHVSMIYQNYNLFYHMTALENAAYPLYMQKLSKQDADHRAEEALRTVGMDEQYDRRLPAMLSGGEQQRVAIARALAAGNELILADEPTGNLDSENSRNIVEILRKLAHEKNRCVIVVTHDPAVADCADVRLTMRDGAFVQA